MTGKSAPRFRASLPPGGSRIDSHGAGKNGIIHNKRWTCERTCSGRRMRYSAAYPTGAERLVSSRGSGARG